MPLAPDYSGTLKLVMNSLCFVGDAEPSQSKVAAELSFPSRGL